MRTFNDHKPKIRGTFLPPGPFPLQFVTVKYNNEYNNAMASLCFQKYNSFNILYFTYEISMQTEIHMEVIPLYFPFYINHLQLVAKLNIDLKQFIALSIYDLFKKT
jgi:hypothetical protein